MHIKQTKLWIFLSTIKLAIWLLSAIALFSLVGTLMPRSNIYSSWWFILLLFLFSLNLTTCLLNRFSLKKNSLGSFLAHVSILVILTGSLIGILFGQKDYIKIGKGREVNSIMVRGLETPLGFSIRLDDFIYSENVDPKEKLLVYQRVKPQKGVCNMRQAQRENKMKGLLARIFVNTNARQDIGNTGYKVKVIRYVPDFVMDTTTKEVSNRSANPNNPAVEIELEDPKGGIKSAWLFARFPDTHQEACADFDIVYNWATRRPKDFISKVTVLKDGREILSKDIRVNTPLNFEGYNFFQASYDSEGLSWSGIQVVKDPGVPVIYAGFVLLILGLVMIFYVGPLRGR